MRTIINLSNLTGLVKIIFESDQQDININKENIPSCDDFKKDFGPYEFPEPELTIDHRIHLPRKKMNDTN